MNDAEKAASEYAEDKIKNEGWWEQRHCYIDSFLAGYNFALKPRRIDPNDENTWPPENVFLFSVDLLEWSVSSYGKITSEQRIEYNKNNVGCYWLPAPLPPTPQEE